MSSSPPQGSHSSLSPSNSQSHSQHGIDIPLETLVSHLLASKRSLASISTVWRANEIATSARTALEESLKLSARTGFLRQGILEQVKILRKVRGGIENVYKEGQRDFKKVIQTLDGANERLESTMKILRSTMVEAAFRPEAEPSRSLLDFVDEEGVETMRNTLKQSIRDSNEAQTSFDTSILSLDDDLRALKAAMTATPSLSPSLSHVSLHSSPIPENLHSLEIHAQEMAALLDSLVSHFDLCVNAIRHTEGGYAAVSKAASDLPPGAEPVSVSGVMNTSQDIEEETPMSEEERREMLVVLENDASEVEDVVAELRERLGEMESRFEVIQDHVSYLTVTFEMTTSAFSILESISAHLPRYLMACSDFKLHWEETKMHIQEQLEELEGMRLFYESYYASYDHLILEVYRRRQAEDKVKAMIKKATEQIEKVVEADMRERQEFRGDVGDFLPGDLWTGVAEAAPRWEFVKLGKDGLNESLDSPVLERGVVEAASNRNRERQRLKR